MYVIKRSGQKQPVQLDQITERLRRLCEGLSELVDPILVTQRVTAGLKKGMTTAELDMQAAEVAAYLNPIHPDYGVLAARICISNLQKQTVNSFLEVCRVLVEYINPKTGKPSPLISEEVWRFIRRHHLALEKVIDYRRDFQYDYFGFKTLQRSYLMSIDGRIVERPQHMLMRVACGIHAPSVGEGKSASSSSSSSAEEEVEEEELRRLAAVIESYELLSQGYFIHATPTLYSAGTPRPQMSSCFLLTMKDDSIEGIADTWKQCSIISKYAGGVGLSISQIRAAGSYIAGTNGESNGLVPMLRVFNNIARYVDQGGGKRKGSFAIYLEPWHADIFDVLEMKKNHGSEELRARDLFYALWIPDLFMRRVESDGMWSLMCPHECPGLDTNWGTTFEEKYRGYEETKRYRKQVRARELWGAILTSQIETGGPYMLYKDACNGKSNQQNLGCIRSSNLCTEIIEYTDPDNIAVCNLASIALPKFVVSLDGRTVFDHGHLAEIVRVVTRNLNRIIDVNYYPLPEARHSNLRNRPLGIGVQGLAETFILLRLPYDSEEAQQLNRDIFETIYFASLTESHALAERDGPYDTFTGSPASRGLLQFDLWKQEPEKRRAKVSVVVEGKSSRPLELRDWSALKVKIQRDGLRNSLLLAPMPTASTSQILGYTECFEPLSSNLYVRRVLSGEFVCFSRLLLQELIRLGLWSERLRQKIVAANGIIGQIPEIPEETRRLFRTVWEIKGRSIIDMAAGRGKYICQSQSLNAHLAEPNPTKLGAMHFYAWKSGLKTGMYYLRGRPSVDAVKVTVDPRIIQEIPFSPLAGEQCRLDDPSCESCSG